MNNEICLYFVRTDILGQLRYFPMNFKLKENKLVEIGPLTENWALWFRVSFEVNFERKNLVEICTSINKKIGLLWFRESFKVNYNIGFGIPIKFPSQRKYKDDDIHKLPGSLRLEEKVKKKLQKKITFQQL